MGKIKKASVLAACLVLMLTFASCSKNEEVKEEKDSAPTQSEADTSQEAQQEDAAEGQGSWALDINTVTLDGSTVTTADFEKNKLTVLNVWATWCPPCVAELPHLEEVSEHYKDKGVQIVGVLQDGVNDYLEPDEGIIKNAKTLLSDAGAGYTVILPDETIAITFISQMQYFPTTFFLDSQGNIVDTVVGANDADSWKEAIDGALSKLS